MDHFTHLDLLIGLHAIGRARAGLLNQIVLGFYARRMRADIGHDQPEFALTASCGP